MSWADSFRKLKVRTNSETPLDSKVQEILEQKELDYAEQSMFFDEERILSVRQMILSKSKEDRANALQKLLPIKKKIFMKYLNCGIQLP